MFEQHDTPATQIYSRSYALVAEFFETYSKSNLPSGYQHPSKWSPPPRHTFKINVDSAWKNQEAAIGIIARDNNGAIIHSVSSPCARITSVEHVQLQAAISGLRLAVEAGYPNIILESDSITRVQVPDEDLFPLGNLVAEAKELIARFSPCSPRRSHIGRQYTALKSDITCHNLKS